MKALQIRLEEEVQDTSLRKLGEIEMQLQARGNGSAVTECQIVTDNIGAYMRSASGKAIFSTNSSFTSPSSDIQLPLYGFKVYIKASQDDIIFFGGITNITRLGEELAYFGKTDDMNNNAPVIMLNADRIRLMPKLVQMYLGNRVLIDGDVKYLNQLYAFLNQYSSPLYGNISVLDNQPRYRLNIVSNGAKGNIYGSISNLNVNMSLKLTLTANNIALSGKYIVPDTIKEVAMDNVKGCTLDFSAVSYTGLISCSIKGAVIGSLDMSKVPVTAPTSTILINSSTFIISGDMSILPRSIRTFDVSNTNGGVLTYMGSGTGKFTDASIVYINLPNNEFEPAQLDNLLKAISYSDMVVGTKINLKGNRTAASDAAVSTITSKGGILTITTVE